MSIEELLKELSISDTKISELLKKPHITDNISRITKVSHTFTRLHYSLACTAPKNVDVGAVSKLIDAGLIKHENMLRCAYSYYEKHISEPIEEYVKSNDVSEQDIMQAINSKKGRDKPTILRDLKKEMPYADFKLVMEILNREMRNSPPETSNSSRNAPQIKNSKFPWLDEGEISLLCEPQDNKQASEEILSKHLERTGSKVVTRFPPEPNGDLHIGHAKALNLNFNYAEKFGGKTYLRFDDTNPRNEKKEHYESILEDIEWLGFKPDKLTASSDYNDFMNEKSEELIRKGKAYICHCTLDDIRNRRQIFQKERDEGRFDPTILSPYRNRGADENLKIFREMLEGKYSDGEAVLRFKMDLTSKNPMMLDLVGSRVIKMKHPGKDRNWHVYPSYEFALCVADSLEDVTHSFCSREFLTRQESYHWLLRNLEMYEPVQWEFSRLNLSNTVLSKRKMNELVKKGLSLDDPRLFTIKGMRRRGFTPDAINRFVRSLGLTFSESVVDVKILENFVRTDLNAVAKRIFCLKDPLKVTISNLSKKRIEIPAMGATSSPLVTDVKKVVHIAAEDFCEDSAQDTAFMRLTPKQPVGLIGLGTIRFVEKTSDGIVCELCEEKPKKHIQWLADLTNKVTLRLYSPLFNSFNPDQIGYLNDLNMDSCEVVTAYCDSRIKGSKPLDKFQFVRMGFFCCDYDSKESDLIFNLTLPLRNGFGN